MVAWASGLLEVLGVDFVPTLYSWVSTPSLGGAAVLVGGGLVAWAACRRAKHPDSVAVWWEENAAHDRRMWWREVALLVSLVYNALTVPFRFAFSCSGAAWLVPDIAVDVVALLCAVHKALVRYDDEHLAVHRTELAWHAGVHHAQLETERASRAGRRSRSSSTGSEGGTVPENVSGPSESPVVQPCNDDDASVVRACRKVAAVLSMQMRTRPVLAAADFAAVWPVDWALGSLLWAVLAAASAMGVGAGFVTAAWPFVWMTRWVRFAGVTRVTARFSTLENLAVAKSAIALRIAHMGFYMFMLTHCVACAWWVLGRYERGEADQLADNSFLPPAEVLNRPRRLQYLGALYWASLGCDNAEPVTQLDMVFHTVAQGLSYLSGILVVGQAASLLANYDASATAVREKVASVSTYLHDIGLPKHMQLTVHKYYLYLNRQLQNSLSVESMLSDLNDRLRTDVLFHMNAPGLRRVRWFQSAPETLIRDMVGVLRHQLYCPKQHIIKQGEWGRELYLVSVGYVDVINEHTGALLGPRLGPGSHFGEIGLLFHVNRTASVVAVGWVTVFVLLKDDFHDLLDRYPGTARAVASEAAEEVRKMKGTGVDSSMISILSQGQLTRTRSGASMASAASGGSTSPRMASAGNLINGDRTGDDRSSSGKRLLPRSGSGRSTSSNGSRGTDLADIGENVADVYDGESTESDSGSEHASPHLRAGMRKRRLRQAAPGTSPPHRQPSVRVVGRVDPSSRTSEESGDGAPASSAVSTSDAELSAAFMITPSTRRLIRNHAKSGPAGRRRRHTIGTAQARRDLAASSVGGDGTVGGEVDAVSTSRHSPPARSPSAGDVLPPLPRRPSFRARSRGRGVAASDGADGSPTAGAGRTATSTRSLADVVAAVTAATGVAQPVIQRLLFRHISSAAVDHTAQAILSWEAGFLAAASACRGTASASVTGAGGAEQADGTRSASRVKRTEYGPDADYVTFTSKPASRNTGATAGSQLAVDAAAPSETHTDNHQPQLASSVTPLAETRRPPGGA